MRQAARPDRSARPRLWSALLLLVAVPAHAQSTVAVVLPMLALFGLVGGIVAGLVAGWRGQARAAFWPGFGIYLGLLSVVGSTRAGSLEAVPLTLVLGAAAGIAPFAVAWFLLRAGVGALRRRLHPGWRQTG